VPELLAAADVLVQPGRSDAFNDYRFPSKLPEFLASGRPVVLPRTNIGLHLEDGVEALLLERGGADEIAEKVAFLAVDPELRAMLGERGREFAFRELRWSKNVSAVVDLYRGVSA
jgi:glycosyltransferase involved in cell wall biosynthesis